MDTRPGVLLVSIRTTTYESNTCENLEFSTRDPFSTSKYGGGSAGPSSAACSAANMTDLTRMGKSTIPRTHTPPKSFLEEHAWPQDANSSDEEDRCQKLFA